MNMHRVYKFKTITKMGNLSNKQKKVLDEIIEGGLLTDAVTYMDDEYGDIEDELLNAMNFVYMRNYVDEDHLDLDEVCDNFSAEEILQKLSEQ